MKKVMLCALVLNGLMGCADDTQFQDLVLSFASTVDDEDVLCSRSYAGVGQPGTNVEIKDFRLYLSNFRLVTAAGAEKHVTLTEDGQWQSDNTVLLDFEDGTGSCAELGTPEMNDEAIGRVESGPYAALRFDVGVPFEQNHQDASTAPAPFGLSTMQWNWQGGYKFVRIDLLNENSAPDNAWLIHVGSTGCQSAGPTAAPTMNCSRPNRATIQIDNFDAQRDEIVVDLATLLQGVDVSSNTVDTPPGCMSGSDDPECDGVLEALGLSLETGNCQADCAGQKLFYLR